MSTIISEIKERANGRWLQIFSEFAPSLRPAMERIGKHVPCPFHGGKDGFRLFPDAQETGGGICNTCGTFADGISLLSFVNGWDMKGTLPVLARELDIPSRKELEKSTVVPLRSKKKVLSYKPVQQQVLTDYQRAQYQKKVDAVLRNSLQMDVPAAEPARLYLARRGLSVTKSNLPLSAVRFNGREPYYTVSDDNRPQQKGVWPCLVSAIQNQKGVAVGIHRTFLTSDGLKAPVKKHKKVMGLPKGMTISGSAIRLFPANELVALTEGVETALAVRNATGLPVWATVSAVMMEAIELPESIRSVCIFTDKDRKGRGQIAGQVLADRLRAKGIAVAVFEPQEDIPEGSKGIDWLDVLNRWGTGSFPNLIQIMSQLEMRKQNQA